MGENVTGNVKVTKVAPPTAAPKRGKAKKAPLQIKVGKGKVSIKGRTTAKGRAAAFIAAVKKAARKHIK